jgi:hypothetical protein
MECLINIVGLTETANDCDMADLEPSLSGLYLNDTTAGRLPLKTSFWNESEIIPKVVPDAIKEAVRQLEISTNKRLRKNYREQFTTIGFKNDWTGYLPTTDGYYFMMLRPKNIKGGIFKIREINFYLNVNEDVTFKIIQDSAELFSGLRSTFTGLTVNLDQPVFIAYQTVNQPKDFQYKGCSTCMNKQPTHTGYLELASGTVDTLEELPYNDCTSYVSNTYCQGIEVKGNLDCDGFRMLCDIDFQNSAFGKTFAYLVQQIARKNIAYWLLTNDKVTPYTIVKGDELTTIMNFLVEEIEKSLNYLPEMYDHSDCFVCSGMHKGEILC